VLVNRVLFLFNAALAIAILHLITKMDGQKNIKHEEVSPKVIGKMLTRFQYMSQGIFTVQSSDGIPSCQKFPVSIITENSSRIYPEPDLKLLCSAH